MEDALEGAPVVRLHVDLEVLLQVGARGELLLAVLALEGFLSSVDSLMADQI